LQEEKRETNRKMRCLKQIGDYVQQALPSDGQLLATFLATRDEAAFTALVRRHGLMVLGVCKRVLHHARDAKDAFQAMEAPSRFRRHLSPSS